MDYKTALGIAKEAHRGQRTKSGEPYIRHALRVAKLAGKSGMDALVVGILHDVVEDTPVTLDELIDQGLTPKQAKALDAVTRRSGEVYATYVRRAASNPIARVVKRADLEDHLAPERIGDIPDSLVKRYQKAISMVEEVTMRKRKERAITEAADYFHIISSTGQILSRTRRPREAIGTLSPGDLIFYGSNVEATKVAKKIGRVLEPLDL